MSTEPTPTAFCPREYKPYWKDLTDLELQRGQANLERGTSKTATVFQILRHRKGQWTDLPRLGQAARCRCVSALIAMLRKRGCVIENLTDKHNNEGPGEEWEVKSWYKLVKEPKDVLAERDAQPNAGNLL